MSDEYVTVEEQATLADLMMKAIPEETDDGVAVAAVFMILNVYHGESMKIGDIQNAHEIVRVMKNLLAAFELRMQQPAGPVH